ncbi:MAG: FAD-dependent oxidoreductase [Thermoplasmata archaeon]
MIVIIGLGTSGVYATRWITTLNRDEEITIIERHSYESYSPCGIPLILKKIDDFSKLKHPFPRTKRINVLIEHEAIGIDAENKIIKVLDKENKEIKEIKYDKLLFAAGADPLIPKIKNANEYMNNGIFVVKTLEDANSIKVYLQENNVKDVSVIGAGAIGLEIAHALKTLGFNVHVFEMLTQPFPNVLDPEVADIVKLELEKQGIILHLSSRVDEIIIDNGKINGVKSGDLKFESQAIILATGVVPNTKILNGIIKMERNFILVNERMQTSNNSIYAAGDCVLINNYLNGSLMPVQLATTAAKQGIVAGINMAGYDAIYKGALGAFVSTIGKFEVAAVGITETKAKEKFEIITARAKALDKPEYAGGEEITLKIICEKNQGIILGAQAVGKNASSKINVLSLAIRKKATVFDLSALETAYCPEVSDLYDVINMAADLALRKLNPKSYVF